MLLEYLNRARLGGTPLIDGEMVTFLWEGDRPVRIFGDFNCWGTSSAPEMVPAGPGLWMIQMEFPHDAYMEYSYLLDGERRLDPLNRRSISNGTGERNNYFYMPDARPTPLTETNHNVPGGKVSTHVLRDELRLANRKRTIYLYQPPTDEPSPLLVVFDGRDYYRRGKVTRIVDHLIAQKQIRPIALALVDNAGSGRYVEYACSDSTVSFILNQVIPLAQNELSLTRPDQGEAPYSLLGASMGGLMALYTALRTPQIFDSAICQAGAFTLNEEDFSIFDLVERGCALPIKIWLDVGRFDFLYPTNMRMAAALQQSGYDVRCSVYNGGHNYTSWRNHLADGLIHCWKEGSGNQAI